MKASKGTRAFILFLSLSILMSAFGCAGGTPNENTVAESQNIEPNSDETTLPYNNSTESTQAASDINEASAQETSDTTEPTAAAFAQEDEFDETQMNSIAMLNYLAVLSQEINSSTQSRLFLEEAYSSLLVNINPEKVDELTQRHLQNLLDTIEQFRFLSVKQERLQLIFDQKKAAALKELIPRHTMMLRNLNIKDKIALLKAASQLVISSISRYLSRLETISQEFLRSRWELDDQEKLNLHESRKQTFLYMIEIVRENELPGELALNEKNVDEFVSWKNNTNYYQKIQFFESQQDTYRMFGDYWLVLADCYYNIAEYEKCLEAIDQYESLNIDIFRKDYSFAKLLPEAIIAASEIYGDEQYVLTAERYLELLVDNTENSDWSSRYFASEVYLDLYARTQNTAYLQNAYELTLNNVNNLVAKQLSLNSVYLSEVEEIAVPEEATKDEKRQIEEYNKSLHNDRKTELPPVYEPLLLNCDLLFALADTLEIDKNEQEIIDEILHGNQVGLFLSETLENRYSFSPIVVDRTAEFYKDKLVVPAVSVCDNSAVKVTVTSDGAVSVYDDWVVKEVERPSDDITDFTVTYTSKAARKQVWSANAVVDIEIYTDKADEYADTKFKFNVSKYNALWLLPDIVEFVQVN